MLIKIKSFWWLKRGMHVWKCNQSFYSSMQLYTCRYCKSYPTINRNKFLCAWISWIAYSSYITRRDKQMNEINDGEFYAWWCDKVEIIDMTQARDRKKSKSSTGIKPMYSQTPGGHTVHCATRTHGEQGHLTEFMYDMFPHTARKSNVESHRGKW